MIQKVEPEGQKLKLMIVAASAALMALGLNSQACADPRDERPLPLDTRNVQITKIGVMHTGLPTRATGVDSPIDMSAGNAAAQSMVNSGQVSPAAGAAGGLIGALVVAAIDAGIDSNRNGKIEKMLTAQSFDARSVFDTALRDALTEGNISTRYQTSASRPEKDQFFQISASPDTDFDAVVDVIIYQYGFTIDGLGWRPSVSAQVQMHDVRTGDLMMNEYVMYGRTSVIPPAQIYPGSYEVSPGQPTIIVPFDASNLFHSVDAYTVESPEQAVATLTQALEATARSIASLITVAAPAAAQQAVADDAAELADQATMSDADTPAETSDASINIGQN